MIYIYKYNSFIGNITVASNGELLTGLWFDGQKYFDSILSEQHEQKKLPIFDCAKHWLDIYFCGGIPDFMPPLLLEGTSFRKSVWEILLSIPYGRTITYGEIARKIAKQRELPRMSAQAIGNAVGHNPISIIVPCHRVVGANGSLTGYAGGIDKKVKLLTLEKLDMSVFFCSKKRYSIVVKKDTF